MWRIHKLLDTRKFYVVVYNFFLFPSHSLILFSFKPRFDCVSEMERARRKKIKNGAGICCCKMCRSMSFIWKFLLFLCEILLNFSKISLNVNSWSTNEDILRRNSKNVGRKDSEKFHKACGAWKKFHSVSSQSQNKNNPSHVIFTWREVDYVTHISLSFCILIHKQHFSYYHRLQIAQIFHKFSRKKIVFVLKKIPSSLSHYFYSF